MTAVRSLAYVGLDATDPQAWRSFAAGPLAAPATTAPDGTVQIRLDHCRHRIAVHPSDRNDLAYVGWELDDKSAMTDVVRRLNDAGIAVTGGSVEEAAQRGVEEMCWFTDPGGFRTELVRGMLWLTDDPVHPTRAMDGFRGIGHIVLATSAFEETLDLYQRVLGFKLTDYREPSLYFLRCSPRHHSLALAAASESRAHHLFIEVESINDVGRAYDAILASEHPVTATLGRHSNDLAISFYVESPSGIQVEYGTGSIEVDDQWVPHRFTHGDLWGHARRFDPTIVATPPASPTP